MENSGSLPKLLRSRLPQYREYVMEFYGSALKRALQACLILFLISTTEAASAQSLHLNEIMSSNSATIADDDGDYPDWIELFNSGETTISLQGYGLSDNYNNPFKWTFPDVDIQPGQFMLIWASGKNRTEVSGPLHTNFSIAAAGEEIILTTPEGARIDELAPVAIPTDISIGRETDGTGDWVFFSTPTPGAPNGGSSYTEILTPVTFSLPGGFYTGNIEVALGHDDSAVTIVYTRDGSDPDINNLEGTTFRYKNRYREQGSQSDGPLLTASYRSFLYDSREALFINDRSSQSNTVSSKSSTFEQNPGYIPSQPVRKATVIKARAYKPGARPSETVAHTYFINPSGRGMYTLPVISISLNEDYLFDYDKGIYTAGVDFDTWRNANQFAGAGGGTPANYGRRGVENEYPAFFEFFENEATTAVLNHGIGVRIHGGFSRSWRMKSFRLYARGEYGESRFRHRVFPNEPFEEYNRFVLRNSGNDFGYTMFRDAAIHRMVSHMDIEVMAYRPSVVFLNGEYWGLHNIRERYDRHYIARKYNLDGDRVDILTGNNTIVEGSNSHYVETLSYIQNFGLSDNSRYEHIKTRIDIENFIDYQIVQIFIGNQDWPGNNIDYWRYQAETYDPDAPAGQDGRWRWMLYDTDFGFNLYNNIPASTNSLQFATNPNGPAWPNPSWSTFMLRSLLQNSQFRTQFINRFADQLNTAFLTPRLQGIIDEIAAEIQPAMNEHIQRWSAPNSMNTWQGRVNDMRNYASQRPSNMRNHIQSFFSLPGQTTFRLDIETEGSGYIQVNSIRIHPDTPGVSNTPYPWTGTYFRNVPVRLRAIPASGYRFSHWEGILVEQHFQEISINPSSANVNLTAVFVPDENAVFTPSGHLLREGTYQFSDWPYSSPSGSFPDHMAFVYMDENDPGLEAEIEGFTNGVYNLTSRTRINGQGDDGFSFINTGNAEGNPGYPGMRLGGALLGLNTLGRKDIEVTWEGVTINRNSRLYSIRLQYRIGDKGPFKDVPDPKGNPVEYIAGVESGSRALFSSIELPDEVDDKPYVQLLWRYYFTGVQTDPESGQRSELGISEIEVKARTSVSIPESEDEIIKEAFLYQNYPNPFNPETTIRFRIPEAGDVRLLVYDVLGRQIATLHEGDLPSGYHEFRFDATGFSSGVYLYRLETTALSQTQKMLLMK